MGTLYIALIVLLIAGIWVVIEIGITLRRSRSTMDKLDGAISELNDTLAETRPVIAKLDGTLDDIQLAISRVEPLLESATTAVDALSSNLVEVEAVVRDVSTITGTAASASDAVSSAADTASDAVRRLFGRKKAVEDTEHVLEESSADRAELSEPAAAAVQAVDAAAEPEKRYYTYDAAEPETDGAVDSSTEE